MRNLLYAVTLSLAGLAQLASAENETSEQLPNTIERIKASIVAVGTVSPTRRPPNKYTGTGFVVGDGTLIITNSHTITEILDAEGKETLAVFLPDGGGLGDPRPAQLLLRDKEHDIAVLKLKGAPLPALALADSDRVREGEGYAFTGFPLGPVLGLTPVTHHALISAITPIAIPVDASKKLNAKLIKRLGDPYHVFQLDATAYPGNSGSPLYDQRTGKVIGVINKVFVQEGKESVIDKPSGISYAIPINFTVDLLRRNDLPLASVE